MRVFPWSLVCQLRSQELEKQHPMCFAELPDWMLEPLIRVPAPAASQATVPAVTDPLCSVLRSLCGSRGGVTLTCWLGRPWTGLNPPLPTAEGKCTCCAMKLTELFVNPPGCVYCKYPTHHFLPHPRTNTYRLSQVSALGVFSTAAETCYITAFLFPTEALNIASFLHGFTSSREQLATEKLCEERKYLNSWLWFRFITALKMKPVFGWKEEVSVQLYRKNDTELVLVWMSAVTLRVTSLSVEQEHQCQLGDLKCSPELRAAAASLEGRRHWDSGTLKSPPPSPRRQTVRPARPELECRCYRLFVFIFNCLQSCHTQNSHPSCKQSARHVG